MPVDREEIERLIPDNTTRLVTPERVREGIYVVADVVDTITVAAIRASAIDDAGDGTPAGDVNATDFSGRADPDPAPNTYLPIPEGSFVQIEHKNTVYFWMGPSGVNLGLGGNYTAVDSQLVAAGSDDHSLLVNRDGPDQHPIDAITGLRPELDSLGGTDFSDLDFRISDHVEPTSKIAFEAGNIVPGNERTITMPDRDVDLGALLRTVDAFATLVWAGYAQFRCPTNEAFEDLGGAYQKLDIFNEQDFLPLRIVTDTVNSQFQFDHDGVYRYSLSGSMGHNSVNGGRNFNIRFFDATDGVQIGDVVPIGTGRSADTTNINITGLVEVTEDLKNHLIEIHIGGGSSYSLVYFYELMFGVENVGEWRDPIPV